VSRCCKAAQRKQRASSKQMVVHSRFPTLPPTAYRLPPTAYLDQGTPDAGHVRLAPARPLVICICELRAAAQRLFGWGSAGSAGEAGVAGVAPPEVRRGEGGRPGRGGEAVGGDGMGGGRAAMRCDGMRCSGRWGGQVGR
jgi:hypothetical protein